MESAYARFMITERPDYDLALLAEHFTTCGDYTKEVILEELEYWQKTEDFLCLISDSSGGIDGFLIGYRNRNSLWIAQIWHKGEVNFKFNTEVLNHTKEWARERGMTSITGETKRNEIRAMERYGFSEFSVNVRYEL